MTKPLWKHSLCIDYIKRDHDSGSYGVQLVDRVPITQRNICRPPPDLKYASLTAPQAVIRSVSETHSFIDRVSVLPLYCDWKPQNIEINLRRKNMVSPWNLITRRYGEILWHCLSLHFWPWCGYKALMWSKSTIHKRIQLKDTVIVERFLPH